MIHKYLIGTGIILLVMGGIVSAIKFNNFKLGIASILIGIANWLLMIKGG